MIGGGLLGLEAAKAAFDLSLETHVVEFAPRLMPRQIDDAGSRILVRKIESLGVRVHLNKATKAIHGNGRVERMEFADGDVDRRRHGHRLGRHSAARRSGAGKRASTVGERGGIVVNDRLETSDPRIFAIGECALHGGMVYGLVAPGYEMAEIVAANLTGGDRRFRRRRPLDQAQADGRRRRQLRRLRSCRPTRRRRWCSRTRSRGVYKKLLFSPDGTRLLGGILVGDAADYGTLSMLAKSDAPLPCQPHELIVGSAGRGAAVGLDAMPDSAQVCSCNNVTKGPICAADSRRQDSTRVDALKTLHARPAPAAAAACRW